MDRRDALRILELFDEEEPELIRKKYRDLIRRYHPDMTDSADAHLEKTQQLTQAYRFLKVEGYLSAANRRAQWGIKENKAAFITRPLFMEEELSGREMIVNTGISGRFYWDPEMEPFSLFLRSVNAVVQKILSRYTEEDLTDDSQLSRMRVKLLHLLIQQFVDPYETIKTATYVRQAREEEYHYRVICHVKKTGNLTKSEILKTGNLSKGELLKTGNLTKSNRPGTEYPVRLRGNNLVADLAEGESVISFPENELYYIITPMILQGAARGVLRLEDDAARAGRKNYRENYWKAELRLTVDAEKGWDATEQINEEIRRMLAECE